jgi:MFS family permease
MISGVKLLTDVTPLRAVPPFRRLWTGSTLSQVGGSMTTFAITLQVYETTGSTAAVGAIGVAVLIPMLAIALPGGSLADLMDRRKLILVMTIGQATVSALLFAQALLLAPPLRASSPAGGHGAGHDAAWLWVVYVLVAASSALSAINAPARRAIIPALVPADQLKAALALNRVGFQVMLIAGPALAGLVAGAFGLKACYLIDTVSFAGALYGVGRLPAMPPASTGTRLQPRAHLRQIASGLSFIGRTPALAGAFLTDVSATFFALPVSLFPAVNALRFGADPRVLGLFTASIGVGGMVSAVLSGPITRVSRQGLGMLVSASAWGLSFAVFAISGTLWLTLAALAVAGAADTFTVVFRGIIVAAVTPDELRGRVSAADYVVGAGGGELGSLESGVLGSLTTPVISALSGGLLAVAATVVIAAALPGFRHYRTERGPGAPLEPQQGAGATSLANTGSTDAVPG